MPPTTSTDSSPPRLAFRWQVIVWGSVTAVAVVNELREWLNSATRPQRLSGWLSGANEDWLPYLPLLLAAPLFAWGVGGARKFRSRSQPEPHAASVSSRPAPPWLVMVTALALASVGTAVSWKLGNSQQDLPPAYHDEYSYLFQAECFLAGRCWYPSFGPAPELFDQMHVLNEGHFACRYFPGTGFWIAPFLALGDPRLGYNIAQGLCCALVFLIGRQLSTFVTGLLAGGLFALSPGMILFSQLLLAHHPTLLGLLFFTWMFLRWRDHPGLIRAVLAGCGLSLAMLCRPMTAAAYGLPFGLWFANWWLRRQGAGATRPEFGARTVQALALAMPLMAGMAGMLVYNAQITGSALVSPYQLYTELHTPRHVYGFNNGVRGEQHRGPKVIDNYDRWAQNLTPSLAVQNEWVRSRQSLRWTLGLVPMFLAVPVILLTLRSTDTGWRLVLAAIVSLHLAHLPYWFEGIMGWHYVLETAPLLLLLFAEATNRLWNGWREQERSGLRWWWCLLILLAATTNLFTVVPLWKGRLPVGLAELRYPREIYARFRAEVDARRGGQDAIVFVLPDPADVSLDFVTNPPSLTGPVLVARLRDRSHLDEMRKLFPNRLPLLFDAHSRTFQEMPQSAAGGGA